MGHEHSAQNLSPQFCLLSKYGKTTGSAHVFKHYFLKMISNNIDILIVSRYVIFIIILLTNDLWKEINCKTDKDEIHHNNICPNILNHFSNISSQQYFRPT